MSGVVRLRANLLRVCGGLVGYGCLAAFLFLTGVQVYRWLRDGEWTSIGITDGLRDVLEYCGVQSAGTGRLPSLLHWLAVPTDWLGWHKVLEVIPASMALFALSVLGNCVYIYGSEARVPRDSGA